MIDVRRKKRKEKTATYISGVLRMESNALLCELLKADKAWY
jgi:hypothetical protein